jgi:hypothetical protein
MMFLTPTRSHASITFRHVFQLGLHLGLIGGDFPRVIQVRVAPVVASFLRLDLFFTALLFCLFFE